MIRVPRIAGASNRECLRAASDSCASATFRCGKKIIAIRLEIRRRNKIRRYGIYRIRVHLEIEHVLLLLNCGLKTCVKLGLTETQIVTVHGILEILTCLKICCFRGGNTTETVNIHILVSQMLCAGFVLQVHCIV